MKFLIAEDDKVSGRILEHTLNSFGEASRVADGQEAYDSFCDSVREGKPFDVIFLDVNLPVMNGHDALAAIRNLEEKMGIPSTQGVKVIITTGDASQKSIYEATAASCVDYLIKPVDRERLFKALNKVGIEVPDWLV